MPDVVGDAGQYQDFLDWLQRWTASGNQQPRHRVLDPAPAGPGQAAPKKPTPTPQRSPGQAPRVRPGLPEPGVTPGPGWVGAMVKANVLFSILWSAKDYLFPTGKGNAEILGRLYAEAALAAMHPKPGGGPRRGRARRRAAASGALGEPPRRAIVATATPGAPVQPVRATRPASVSPLAAPANSTAGASATQSAPVAPGTTATQAVIVPKVLGAPVTPLPKPTPQPPKVYSPSSWFPPVKPMVKTFFQDLIKGELELLKARVLHPQRTPKRQSFYEPPPVPEPPIQEQPLTSFNYQGVGYDTATDTCATKKRKPGKARTVCYSGTYRERARGLSKSKRRKIPCLQSRSK